MGTTVVAGLFFDNRISIAHVGDSRLYRLRGGKHRADHAWTTRCCRNWSTAASTRPKRPQRATNKNYVTRALGVEPKVEVEMQEQPVQKGDFYLLCSDGLSDMVEDDDIHLTISTFGANLDTVGQAADPAGQRQRRQGTTSRSSWRRCWTRSRRSTVVFDRILKLVQLKRSAGQSMARLDSESRWPGTGRIQHEQGAVHGRPPAGQRHPHRQPGGQRAITR